MKHWARGFRFLAGLLLAMAIAVLLAFTGRLTADDNYLPLVVYQDAFDAPGAPTLPPKPSETPTSTRTLTKEPAESATPSETTTATTTTATATRTPTSTATDPPTATVTGAPTATGAPSPPAVHTVVVCNNYFSPSSITLRVGDTVIWRRTAGFHNVRADDGSFRLGENPAGDPGGTWATVSHTFTTPGAFGYHCEAHGEPGVGMAGVVVVESDTGAQNLVYGAATTMALCQTDQ